MSLNRSREGIISFFRENGGRGTEKDSEEGARDVCTEASREDRESLRDEFLPVDKDRKWKKR